jgi:hypothetical protein
MTVTREPKLFVYLSRKVAPGGSLASPDVASLFSSSIRLSSHFSLPGTPDVWQLHRNSPVMNDSAEAVVLLHT